MLAKEKEQRQQKLMNCVKKLSVGLLENDEEAKNIADELKEIYAKDFRHNYSDFFPLILELSKEENTYNVEYLAANLEMLRLFIESEHVEKSRKYDSIYTRVEKLCDHINLEIARWNYYSKNEHAIADNIRKIEDVAKDTTQMNSELQEVAKKYNEASKELEDVNNKIENATSDLNNAAKKAESLQTETIAVLSIFAGIVFAFSGGMTFLGSVMDSIKNAEYYEMVVLSAIICGMVVFNTIFLLMYLVGKITDRNIYAMCVTSDCSCEEKCIGLKKIRKRLPYVFWFNILCVIGIIIDCIVWYYDMRGFFNFT